MADFDNDNGSNESNNETFQDVLDARLSRRGFLGGSLATAAGLTLAGASALLKAVPASASGRPSRGPLLGFQGIGLDRRHRRRPCGLHRRSAGRLGRPCGAGPEFAQDASNSADDQARQWGMHNDGVVYFPIDGSHHGLLAQNNEYADDGLLFPDGVANWNEEKTNKSLNAHGVSIIEIKRGRTATARAGATRDRRRTATGTSSDRRSTRAASPGRRRYGSAGRRPVTIG